MPSFLRPLVRDAQEITRNVEAWEKLLGGAANEQERLTGAMEKGSLASAPPGGGAPSGLVNVAGQPISSGVGSGSGGGSGGGRGQGLQSAQAMHVRTIYTPGAGLSWRYDDPSMPDTPGLYLGEIRGEWQWNYGPGSLGARWERLPENLSSHAGSRGGGTGGNPDAGRWTPAIRNAAGNDPFAPHTNAASGRTYGIGRKSLEVTTGEAAIIGELRGVRSELRNLARSDNGAGKRAQGLV